MNTCTAQTYPETFQQQINEVLATPLPGSADLFTVLDRCAEFASVMVECNEVCCRLALCGRLSHALTVLRQRCDEDLPALLVNQLTTDTVPVSNVPECWHDSEMLLDYADALTLALCGKTLPEENSQDLTGLLHDLIFLLVDQLKTPFILQA